VNFPDTLVIRGEYQYKYDPPFVPGHECSGTVLEAGGEVEGLSVGDRVLAMTGVGAFASQVVARPPRSDQVFRIPDAMSWDEAAALNLTYGTAILGLARRAQLQPGESVLVLGAAGGTGSAAVQVAKAMGAYVIGAAGGAEKLAIAERCGADAVVDYREDGLSARVKELTGGRGADVVFDPVGGTDFREYLRCVAWNGRYLVVGFAAGDIPTVGLNLVLLKSVSIVGVAYGAAARLDPAANAENFAQLFRWYDEGRLHPVIGQRFALEDGAEALRVVSGRGALGKVLIEIGT
jgi:NADPH2:quinone reductase